MLEWRQQVAAMLPRYRAGEDVWMTLYFKYEGNPGDPRDLEVFLTGVNGYLASKRMKNCSALRMDCREASPIGFIGTVIGYAPREAVLEGFNHELLLAAKINPPQLEVLKDPRMQAGIAAAFSLSNKLGAEVDEIGADRRLFGGIGEGGEYQHPEPKGVR